MERGTASVAGDEGERHVRIEATDPYGQIKLSLAPVVAGVGQQVRFADFRIRPVAAAEHEGAEFLDSGGAVAGFLRVTGGGELLVLNGNGQQDGAWLGTGVKFPLAAGADVAAGWIKLTIRQDFAAKTWDLFAGGHMVAAGLGFWDATQRADHAFVLVGSTAQPLLFDDLAVTLTNPLFEDVDLDGLPDPWERANGSSTALDDRAADPDGDGRTRLDEYIAEAAANHPEFVPYLSWLAQPSTYTTGISEVEHDLSGLTWNPLSRSLFAVRNSNTGRVFELSPDGHVLRTIRLSTIPGREIEDPEAICWIAEDRFAIAEERLRRITIVRIGGERHAARLAGSAENRIALTAGTSQSGTFAADLAARDNSGLEGLTWDARTNTFIGVLQGDGVAGNGAADIHVFRIAQDGSCDELFDAPALLGSRIADLSDVSYDSAQRTLFLLSNRSKRLLVTDLRGRVIRDLPLNSAAFSPFDAASKPEGVAVLPGGGEFFVAGEPAVLARYRKPPSAEGQGEPLISEFLTKNDAGILDEGGKRRDWIELRNPGAQAVNLEGWALTDSRDALQKWIFPLRVLLPGDALVVFASDKDLRPAGFGALHANFKLSSAAGFLALVRPDGTVRQELDYPGQAGDVSYGLSGVDGSTAGYFSAPTPGTGNGGATSLVDAVNQTAATPEFSLAEAFLAAPAEMTLGPDIAGTTIYYTTDGTEPYPANAAAVPYTGPINLTVTTVLRAARTGANLRPSDSVARTYIFPQQVLTQQKPADYPEATDNSGFTASAGGTYGLDYAMNTPESDSPAILSALRAVPSVSIVADPEDLFWIKEGIYANSSQNGGEWNRRVAFEWIEPGADGTVRRVQVNSEGSILGHSSRKASVTPKHSLRLRFKSKYGPAQLSLPGAFPSSAAETFEQLEVRNPAHDSWAVGSPWSANRNSARYVTDAFASQLIGQLGSPTFARRFVHLYLNGLYWGVYELIEPVDPMMVHRTFPPAADPEAQGAAKSDIIGASDDSNGGEIAGNKVEWDVVRDAAWNILRHTRDGLPVEEAWATVSGRVSLESLTDYILANVWMNNLDWPAHNYLIARRRSTDGKFHFLSWDAEFAFRKDRPVNENTLARVHVAADGPGWLFLKLCHHPDFRAVVRSRLNALTAESAPLTAAAWSGYESLAASFSPVLEAESARWGDAWRTTAYSRPDWQENLNALRDIFLPFRTEILRQQVLAELDGVETQIAQWEAARALAAANAAAGNPSTEPGGIPAETVAEAGAADTDRDGLSDEWEITHGLNPENGDDALLDSDADGLSNLEEYLAGTDPHNPASNRPETGTPSVDLFTSLEPHAAE